MTTAVRGGPVVSQLVTRSWVAMRRIPIAIMPTVIMPIVFTVAFSGSFSAIVDIPGFPTDNILNWMVPYAILQGAAFSGIAFVYGLGRDLEDGFHDRLLLSPAPRWTMGASGVVYCSMRAMIPVVVILPFATMAGLEYPGGPAAVLWLMVASAGIASLAALWGMGVVYRIKTQEAGGPAQLGLFAALFVSVGTTPIEVQQGWLPHVARYNPITQIMNLARAGFVGTGEFADIWPGLVTIAASAVVLCWWAARGFRTLQP